MINLDWKKRFFVVDNFYSDPNYIRSIALSSEFVPNIRYYKGVRSSSKYVIKNTKESFENILGQKIVKFDEYDACGRFQICTPEDPLVYHVDTQRWAAMVYLSPDAPYDSGTYLLSHKSTKARDKFDYDNNIIFEGGFYDKTKFDIVDVIGNVYNRLVIFDASCIHAASQYFGSSKTTGRLTHLFFFD